MGRKPTIIVKHPVTGKFYSISKVAKLIGKSYEVTMSRYKLGWTPSELFGLVIRHNPNLGKVKKTERPTRNTPIKDYSYAEELRERARRIIEKGI